MNGLELEIAEEQAKSLGLAGQRLQEAIDQFRHFTTREHAPSVRDGLLSEIAARVWALMVQRELVGFKNQSLQWVLDRFDVPDEALARLGSTAR